MALAFSNGHYLNPSDVHISPDDYGFARGLSLFDAIRVYGGVAFRLEDHLQRFRDGAESLRIACPYDDQQIRQAIRHLCDHHHYAHSTIYVRLTAGTPQQLNLSGMTADQKFSPHFMIFEHEFKPEHPDAPKGYAAYQQGLKVKTVPFARELPHIKTTNYARGFLALRDLAADGWDEILYTHPDGYVTEAPTSNFFCVIDGVLTTPSRGMLPGVTRKVVLELATQSGLKIAERDITLNDIKLSSEAFIASSMSELFPLQRIDKHILLTTMEGPVFQQLRRAFSAYIHAYTAAHKTPHA